MSNIPPKSSLLGVHVVSAWVMTLFVLWVRVCNAATVHPLKPVNTQIIQNVA